MELRDVEYFAAVAEHRHLGRAADALGISQSALSKCLRRIEDAVSAKIVKRTPKGVEVTEIGSAVLAQGHRLRMAHADMLCAVTDLRAGQTGHLRIGTSHGIPEHLVGMAASRLLKKGRKVSLAVELLKTGEMLAAIRQGKLDLAVSMSDASSAPDLTMIHLQEDQYAVYASVDHPLAKRRRVTLADLSREQWALTGINRFSWDALCRAFEAQGLPPPAVALDSISAVVRFHSMATSGLLHFSPRPFMRRATGDFRFKELPVEELVWTRHIHIIHRKDGYLSPLARRLIELLKTAAEEIASDV
jgi:DNA-binding transcriptional LysR family regulator